MKQNSLIRNLLKNLSLKAIGGIVFGIAAIIGIAMTVAFTEPTSGPTGFSEPADANDTGDWVGYGRGWEGGAGLTQANCDSDTGNWSKFKWFEDANGDGNYTDEEDGICVQVSNIGTASTQNSFTGSLAISWNGIDNATVEDNSYIPAYSCTAATLASGVFGSVDATGYLGVGVGTLHGDDTTYDAGDCVICEVDCLDGVKNLPNNSVPYHPFESLGGGCEGPLTSEILKNWTGTRLPTSNDFFGFCGATTGDADNYTGDKSYYSSGASSVKTLGNYGHNVGRGNNSPPNDEYMDIGNVGTYEWLSAQHSNVSARHAGSLACSLFNTTTVVNGSRFRAVFRP